MTSLERARFGVELLDDPTADGARVRTSLRSIARANRWFGGTAAVRYGLAQALRGLRPDRCLTLLDVGTGMGDLPRAALAWAAARGLRLQPVGLERHPAAARLAAEGGLATAVADGAELPVRCRGVDLVLLSQVAHHFAPSAIVRLVRECDRVARVAVVLADLRRAPVAAAAWRAACPFLGFDPDTVRDGATSLRRGFSAGALRTLLTEAGVRAEVARRPGARLVAVWRPGH